MRTQILLLAALAPLLTACAASQPRTPDVTTPAAFEGQAQVIAGPAIDLDRWWTAYGDPQLEQLVAEAFANGPDAKIIAARLVEARASYITNRATAFPQVGSPGTELEFAL